MTRRWRSRSISLLPAATGSPMPSYGIRRIFSIHRCAHTESIDYRELIPLNQACSPHARGIAREFEGWRPHLCHLKKSLFYLCYFSARPGSWHKRPQAEERVALPELQVRHRLAHRQPETRVSLRRATRQRRQPAARPERTRHRDRIRQIRARPPAVRRRILTPPTARIRTQIQIQT
jgi:hypothetical protein